MSVLGDRLKMLREKRGWTKKYAAEKLNFKGISTYANYEYGIRDPDTDMLVKMAQLYETTTDYLKGVIEDPDKKRILDEQTKNIAIETYYGLSEEDQKLVDGMIMALQKRREK